MPTVEERLAYLEGQGQEHSHAMSHFRDVVGRLEQRMDRLEQRMDGLDRKVDRYREELAARIDRLDLRLDSLDAKVSRQFVWLVGIQVTTLVTVLGAVLARA
jgi:chromosome segregation ATPase